MPESTPLVATLVSNPENPAVDSNVLARARDALPAAHEPEWLADSIAADVAFTADAAADHRAIAERVRAAIGTAPVDVIVQARANRRKKLLLADMDSTIIQQECIDELAACAGIKDHIAAITERAMRGEIEFEPALRERVALLKGLDASVIEQVIGERIALTPGARTMVQTMRKDGARTILVSGGFTAFTGRIAAMTGFDENHANTLLMDNGTLSGLVQEPILGREAKLATLVKARDQLGLAHEAVAAVGDGANDLAMLGEAGIGFAFHAKPAVAAAAHARIDHGDLTALLYAQGYRRSQFAAG